jgi:hypothetical protein
MRRRFTMAKSALTFAGLDAMSQRIIKYKEMEGKDVEVIKVSMDDVLDWTKRVINHIGNNPEEIARIRKTITRNIIRTGSVYRTPDNKYVLYTSYSLRLMSHTLTNIIWILDKDEGKLYQYRGISAGGYIKSAKQAIIDAGRGLRIETKEQKRTPSETTSEKKPSPEAPMFCSKCGNKLAKDASFCSNCGSKIS